MFKEIVYSIQDQKKKKFHATFIVTFFNADVYWPSMEAFYIKVNHYEFCSYAMEKSDFLVCFNLFCFSSRLSRLILNNWNNKSSLFDHP